MTQTRDGSLPATALAVAGTRFDSGHVTQGTVALAAALTADTLTAPAAAFAAAALAAAIATTSTLATALAAAAAALAANALATALAAAALGSNLSPFPGSNNRGLSVSSPNSCPLNMRESGLNSLAAPLTFSII